MTLTQINKAGLDELALDHVFTIGASGTDHYTFQGEGLNGTVNDPTLYLTRGKTYRFENGTGAHPIRIQSTSGASGTAYNTGVTNNAGSGTVIVEVQHDAPDVLYYQCTSHANMNGILYITGALADGGVTTAKIANNAVTETKLATNAVSTGRIIDTAVTTAKLANTSVTETKLATNSVSTSKIIDTAVTTAKIADDAVTNAKIGAGAVGSTEIATNAVTSDKINTGQVTTAKLGDLAVSTAKLGDQAVTLAKLEHGTSSNDGKFLRANNGADPTFETVSGTTINNNADNRIITGSGTANTLNGESNAIIDSSGHMGLGVTPNTNLPSNADFKFLQVGTGASLFGRGSGDEDRGGIAVNYYHTGSAEKYLSNGNSSGIILGDGDIDFFTATANSSGANAAMSKTVAMRIASTTGKVGIGTTSPTEILHIKEGTNKNVHFTGGIGQIGNVTGLFAVNDANNAIVDIGICGSSVRVGTTAGERARFTGDGLTFNGDTAAANALHDYEEGAWSPKLGGTSNYSTYNIDGHGWYVKIGAIVHWALRFNAENLDNSASGGVMIYQFPYQFNRGSGVNSNVSAGLVNAAGQFYQVSFTGSQKHGWYAGNNSTILYGLVIRHATSWVDWPVSDFHSSNMYFMLSGTYRTDS